MITHVHITNFKSLRDVEIDLERFTVFVGANGSGKTSVLKAISQAIYADPTNQAWQDAQRANLDWTYTRGGTGDISIVCVCDQGRFAIQVTPPLLFRIPTDVTHTQEWKFNETLIFGESFEEGRKTSSPAVLLQLNAARLADPSYSDSAQPRIKPDGSGLASVLAFMALNDPDSFQELMQYVRELLPRIKRIRFHRVPVFDREVEPVRIGNDVLERSTKRLFQGESILFDYKHADSVAAHTASDGTLMMVGLLTVLLGPDRPKLLLMDDIEHGLHPLAQKQLVGIIGRIMEKFPDLQILATAHSPYLLDYLSPEQVRIMVSDERGDSRCGKLTDHPKFETWKDEMAPGEMWSLFGEKWLGGAEVAQ